MKAMQTIEITMVAASRVGKTSLLAAMYEHIKPAFDQTDCYIEPIDQTIQELHERKTELCQMFEANQPEEFGSGGIYPTINRREYRFRVGRKGKSPDLEIVFVDIPGGYYTASDPQKREEIDAQIRRSFATLIPIDTAALFEGNGFVHQKVNQPVHIRAMYERVFKNFNRKEQKLVIVTPIKCEKYIQQPGGLQLICDKLLEQQEYRSLLSLVKSKDLEQHIKVAVCPVQTVGGVHVARTELNAEKEPEHILQRVGSYNPRNCHIPLLYLFFSILQMTRDDRTSVPLIGWFRSLFKLDQHLEQAIEKLVIDIKVARRKQEIRILQNPLQNCNLTL